ncbi:MAG: hypothetical protein LBG71_02285 [Clostridiales Family XIII bacterium]|jgi:rRNA maturation protein Nop10|nr:hypothetical protein [Clostridiales Family XIII bacterium]
MKYYSVTGTDNNSEFYYMNDEFLKHCPKCGLIYNREEATALSVSRFRVKKKHYTLSHCWDGPMIVSERFVAAYVKHGLKGLGFVKIPQSPGFYLLRALNVLRYDYARNPRLFMKDQCEECGQWYEVSLANPPRVVPEDEARMEAGAFYRTDLESGEKVERTPMLLATDPIPRLFRESGIKDVYFDYPEEIG